MISLLAFVLLRAQEDAVVIRTQESKGEIRVALDGPFELAPSVKGKVAFIADPKAQAAGSVVVWVSRLSREETAAVLREAKGIHLAIVTGRGGGGPEPLRVGEAWMVQAPGASGLWGWIELRGSACTSRRSAPEEKASSPWTELRGSAKPVAAEGRPAPPETSNRACRLRLLSTTERVSYGAWSAGAGRRLLVLDAELENIIPMTLVQSNQVPTQYRVKDLGDHLYLVLNGNRVSRLLKDAASMPGHLPTTPLTIDRLGARVRGNLVFEIPAEGVQTLDLRFYDYAHGHMALTLREGPRVEPKPVVPLQENEVLEGGIFKVERLREAGGKSVLAVEFRARSRMFTESDATAFDPKAKPGDKLQVGTVSDWTDVRKHLHVLVDGESSIGSSDPLEFGEAPRFLPDLHTGGRALFAVPEKAGSLELRCDFPNARLPDGQVIHPKALLFLLEGKRPEAAAKAPIVEIDDEVFKVAVTGQALASEFAGLKPPAGSVFLVLDVRVTGAGKAGEQFQTPEQLFYATEKGAQLAMHEASFKGPRPAEKLLLVPTGERRSFQAVFAVPAGDRKPRLAYRGVSKAEIVALKPIEAPRACPKCKKAAEATEKFCGECGTKIDP